MKQTDNKTEEGLLDIARRKGGLRTKADERKYFEEHIQSCLEKHLKIESSVKMVPGYGSDNDYYNIDITIKLKDKQISKTTITIP
jgi:hypothetical protein